MAKGRGERREFWRQHVRAWRQSGQRREDYCHECSATITVAGERHPR
jgi:hypothetical protein